MHDATVPFQVQLASRDPPYASADVPAEEHHCPRFLFPVSIAPAESAPGLSFAFVLALVLAPLLPAASLAAPAAAPVVAAAVVLHVAAVEALVGMVVPASAVLEAADLFFVPAAPRTAGIPEFAQADAHSGASVPAPVVLPLVSPGVAALLVALVAAAAVTASAVLALERMIAAVVAASALSVGPNASIAAGAVVAVVEIPSPLEVVAVASPLLAAPKSQERPAAAGIAETVAGNGGGAGAVAVSAAAVLALAIFQPRPVVVISKMPAYLFDSHCVLFFHAPDFLDLHNTNKAKAAKEQFAPWVLMPPAVEGE